MFEDALKYPLRGEDSTSTLLIGGGLGIATFVVALVGVLLSVVFVGLFLLPFALVPGVLVQGYYVDVVRHRLDGDPEPPTFDDWTSLFVDGLKAMLVGILYALPAVAGAFVVALVAVVISFATQGSPESGAVFGGLLTALAVLALFVYGVAAAYVYPAGIVNWVREDDLTAAFSLSTLKAATLDTRYLVAWLLALVVALVGGTVGEALIVVFLVGFFVLFYVQMVVWYCYTEGYVDALDLDRTDGEPEATSGYGGISYEPPSETADRPADSEEWSDLTDATEPADEESEPGRDEANERADVDGDERDGESRRE
ncbi:DUF4013 domain-containing protein [Halarchaeum sp. P4]|uniref:DUF4013 domain-containing protein n=1 Tax=Halarchaeum sp. P4 TaxID=3421639 RepID=UPI003EBEF560